MPNPYDENQNRSNPYTNQPYQNQPHATPPQRDSYRKGDAPNQIPIWVIILLFCIGAWPISIVLLVLNRLISSGTIDLSGRRTATNRDTVHPAYTDPARRTAYTETAETAKAKAEEKPGSKARPFKEETGAENTLMVLGIVFAVLGAVALSGTVIEALPAIAAGTSIFATLEDIFGGLIFLVGGGGMLFGSGKMKASRRMRKKIANLVGQSSYMYIQDIADAIPCSYEKCCGYLENCIDKGVFGSAAYLDMRSKCLVVRGDAPQKPVTKKPETAKPADTADSKYMDILEQLHRVNDAIPDEIMTDKITRLEKVSAKIFEQGKNNPGKQQQMRKFMDYYLPTSLKLLQTYAELDAQGIEGDNISESKHRIEQSMDTLVVAFENQLDKLFEADAMDVSADIDVMENMLRADGLSGNADPFGLNAQTPSAPEPPHDAKE